LVDTSGRRTCPTNALILIVSARSSVLGVNQHRSGTPADFSISR